MKKYFLLFTLVIVALSACKKKDSFDAAAQATADEATIKNYISLNAIPNAVKDPSGLYYSITNPGTGAHPTGSSGVTVSYTLTLADRTAIDSRTSSYFTPLSTLIQGWQIGLPHIGTGGSIILMVPSALAYANEVHGNIPANSVLIFNITLQGFN